ncbi:hypothetical protein B0H14DRAFT_3612564 [Mycena olivaceomarginata]|nr:hypothetical protein B0H14DRAFT_3612564 [Mycena olivaceomarginata]
MEPMADLTTAWLGEKGAAPLWLAMLGRPRQGLPSLSVGARRTVGGSVGWIRSRSRSRNRLGGVLGEVAIGGFSRGVPGGGNGRRGGDDGGHGGGRGRKDADARTTVEISLTLGTCHCEAGLIASMVFQRQQGLEPRDLDEPQPLTDAFADLSVTAGAIAIGVAQKCCPVCRIPIDILRTNERLKVDIVGAHGRFRAWVPPKWLPGDVLDQLEKRLIVVVGKMVGSEHVLSGASAASGGSASDV